MNSVTLVKKVPSPEEYCYIREQVGLSPRSLKSATLGLSKSIYGVSLIDNEKTVGMGRIIGDEGCFLTIVDIAVLPKY
jgi:hypothetical protein